MNPGNGIETGAPTAQAGREAAAFKLMNPGNGIETNRAE